MSTVMTMKPSRLHLLSLALVIVGSLPLIAQDTALIAISGSASPAYKQARVRYGYSDTRAAANFRAANSIEARLGDRGMTLHPQLLVLRIRIEAALGQAQNALQTGDLDTVNETLQVADAMLDRFSSKIGGY